MSSIYFLNFNKVYAQYLVFVQNHINTQMFQKYLANKDIY